MKLIKRTYLQTAIWLLPVLVAGSIFCFYTIRYIIYEEADEFLTYEMERLILYHKTYNTLPDFNKIAGLIEGVKPDKPFFRDTLILEPADNEMVPHRELHFPIVHKGEDFTIVLRHLLPGTDDIIQGTLMIISGLMLLVILVFTLMVNHISGKIWKPFYKTLKAMTRYKINDPVPEFPDTQIDEFTTLNRTAGGLLRKIDNDYRRTKEFNENASHELQTHLAIIRANTEKLINHPSGEPFPHDKLQAIFNSTVRLSRAQKSLLLLSKIGNQEFTDHVDLNLKSRIEQSVSLFREAAGLRNIRIGTSMEDCNVFMDAGLADILINNLVKNAVKHNVENGYINISLDKTRLLIENSGEPFNGNPERLMERFVKGDNGNLGIGLAIAQQICDLYQFKISYNILEKHIHVLQILFR